MHEQAQRCTIERGARMGIAAAPAAAGIRPGSVTAAGTLIIAAPAKASRKEPRGDSAHEERVAARA